VVGATGFTGRLVVAQLAERGASLRLVGRSRTRLAEVAAPVAADFRGVPDWRREELAAALDGCGAVVSCAGPFHEAGKPVVEAAIDARVPYTDSTGEQLFIQLVYEELDSVARTAGMAVVPAFGFDFVPGDVGAAIAAEGLGPLARVDVMYAVERAASSAGTRRSAVSILAESGYQRVDGLLRREPVGAHRRKVATQFGRLAAGSFPGGEPLMLPRHLQVGTVVSYFAVPGIFSPAHQAARLLPVAARIPGLQPLLQWAATQGPVGPSGDDRATRVACVVEATALDGRRRAVRLEGRDPYGFTARALADLATRMRDNRVNVVGARSPAEVVEAREFLAGVEMTVVEVEPEG
jgi:short subunit dehydrogenase-like uncharacterized protein